MNKTEFMRQLESLLQSIPQSEREEALQYYNDYFDDAGTENEKEVIDSLGTPAKVAENIKRDLYGEDGLQSANIQNPPTKYQNENDQEQTNYQTQTESQTKSGLFHRIGTWFASLPGWGKVLTVITGILLSPVLLGAVGSLFGLIIGWFSTILGFAVASMVLLAILIVMIIVGIMCLAQFSACSIVLFGIGLICGSLGVLFMMLTVAMCGIVTPAIFKGISALWQYIWGTKEVAA